MDLPIDHFRLLGVSPSAEADTVLRKLQNRCDNPPDQGFTHEVLIQRDELLRRSADLLTDPERRADYEAALFNLSQTHPNDTVGLDLAASSEVAGLILLWEAQAALEAFQLARQGLQPPQAPALGSGREADLTLLAALACRDAAAEEQDQRRYEAAAQLLRDGIELQQRMGKLPDHQRILEQDLDALRPYRILDLLSRDLGDAESHQQGLRLLDQLVRERGGLEADEPTEPSVAGLSQADFEPFFKQIRRFLTVQEQVDLFTSWRDQGSAEAGCLAVFALTAAGFCRRKPELLEQAREQLRGLATPDLDPMPLLGCLDLLLGNVAAAADHFLAVRDPDLRTWLDQHPGDQLAAQCEYCRAWLQRDVLPGYRDVEATDVDLDAWFADRDVQAYVDRLDRQQARQQAVPPAAIDAWDEAWSSDSATGVINQASLDDGSAEIPEDEDPDQGPHLAIPKSFLIAAASALAVLAVLAGVVNLLQRFREPATVSSSPEISVPPAEQTTEPIDSPSATLKAESAPQKPFQPLVKDLPTDLDLQALIQGWLDRKGSVLSGEPSPTNDLDQVARRHLVDRVLEERTADQARGVTKTIGASVTALELVSRTPQRIEVKAQIAYADKTLDRSGATVEQTAPGTFSVRYIFGRDGDQWKLHAYIPGS